MSKITKESEIIKAIEQARYKKRAHFTIEVLIDVEYLNIQDILEDLRVYGSAEITSFEILESNQEEI